MNGEKSKFDDDGKGTQTIKQDLILYVALLAD